MTDLTTRFKRMKTRQFETRRLFLIQFVESAHCKELQPAMEFKQHLFASGLLAPNAVKVSAVLAAPDAAGTLR